ncbi:MAG: tRNA (adenosine(37)-N6)-threonylcarbamoyltransferase complex dimerization subunit type 1 TsaB [Synergistaceae bacterium]|jgi:tRNA threonylcarbamoyl adenosine modification protein YeaZ|nr:tRNA (adenosine(37)-N6)-threonylcarbamoyltransferase complex dimerization subunit type 1 TsaB [Synergistaceae bacterium]
MILAVDCSLRWTNVALFSEGRVSASERLNIGRRQATELPLMVERLLVNANYSFDDIALVAVTNGPGYFTGIRVGAAYATGLAYGLGVKIVPVSTLYMLAYPFLASRTVLVVVYAGRERLYAASFGHRQKNAQENALPTGEYGSEILEAWLSRQEKGFSSQDVLIVSDDPEKVSSAFRLPQEAQKEMRRVPPDAAIVARIAAQAANRGESISPMDLRISYHRSPKTGGVLH